MTEAMYASYPLYRLHKPSGQGFIEIDDKRHYLGKYEPPETQRAYDTLSADGLAHGDRLALGKLEPTSPRD